MPLISAQTSNGRIAGTVLDQSGATITAASVIVVNERTNERRATQTNGDGNFVFTALQPSSYTLSAAKDGFSTKEIKHLSLNVGQELRFDPTLAVSATSSVVEV